MIRWNCPLQDHRHVRCFPTGYSELISEQPSLEHLGGLLAAVMILQLPFTAIFSVALKQQPSSPVQMGDTGRHNGNSSQRERVIHSCFSFFASLKRHRVSKPLYLIPSWFWKKTKQKQKQKQSQYYITLQMQLQQIVWRWKMEIANPLEG